MATTTHSTSGETMSLAKALRISGEATCGDFAVVDRCEGDEATGEALVTLLFPIRSMRVTLTVAKAYLAEWGVDLRHSWTPGDRRW